MNQSSRLRRKCFQLIIADIKMKKISQVHKNIPRDDINTKVVRIKILNDGFQYFASTNKKPGILEESGRGKNHC